jgi:hypothetical protein
MKDSGSKSGQDLGYPVTEVKFYPEELGALGEFYRVITTMDTFLRSIYPFLLFLISRISFSFENYPYWILSPMRW